MHGCRSTGQSVEAQVRQLTKAGCKKVFRETASGARTDRAQLRKALDQLDNGDVLMVTRLDRLARSTRDLLNTLAAIAGRKAGFRSLGDTWADTTSAHGRLMLTVLGGLAEFERELIRVRTGEGRARAKALGVKMGRPFKMTPHQIKEALRRRDNSEPMRDIARSYTSRTARFHGYHRQRRRSRWGDLWRNPLQCHARRPVPCYSLLRRSDTTMGTTTTTNMAEDVIAMLRAHEAELHRAGIRHLALFGSIARGDATIDSDVDLVAELDPAARIGLFALGALERRLAELIGRRVDLLPEPIEKPRLRANIDRDRQRAF
jgi:DNA invertase Pin-like site-specific DNA recombinase/predicted nucleotidyltransferase